MRKQVIRTTLITACVFLLAVTASALLWLSYPTIAELRIETALKHGNTELARKLTGALSEEKAEQYLTECDYADACADMAAEQYAEAAGGFAALGEFRDAADLRTECIYREAVQEEAEGNTEAAAGLYGSIGGYSDAVTRREACIYRLAEDKTAEGSLTEAIELYRGIPQYCDAQSKAGALACEITGLSDPEAAFNVLQGYSTEDLEQIALLGQLRAALPEGKVAAGFFHTAAVTESGRVLSCGNNNYGQCDTQNLTDAAAVAAGAYHTAVLRRDGTVFATGRNTEGQCNTADWNGITAIAACDYGTLGLKKDGTVVYTGMNQAGFPSNWANVVMICGGSYGAGALTADGTALLSHETAESPLLVNLTELAVNTAYAVGVNGAGKVVSPQAELPEWNNILRVEAAGTGVLAVTADGQLLSRWFRPSFVIDTEDIENAVAVSCRGTHLAVLLQDGSVVSRGLNGDGQCDTFGWNLNN